MHTLGRANTGRFQKECIAKHPQVGAEDLFNNADDGFIQPQSLEKVVVLYQIIDLADPVAGVVHFELSSCNAGFGLNSELIAVAVAVGVFPKARAEAFELVLGDQVFNHDVAIRVVESELLAIEAQFSGSVCFLNHGL